MFETYTEAIEWLYGTQQFGIKLGLDNVEKLLVTLELPFEPQRFIHVAGTNGKGSVCAFSDALLQGAGLRTGLFTSPHLTSYCERIRVNGTCIPEAEVASGLGLLRKTIANWDPHPTFFEVTLALALTWFRDSNVDVVILETGMGGRLDATNAITPVVSVITPIALDHQKWLGDTIDAIAREKAGIFKAGISVVSAKQVPAARAALEQVSSQVGAPLTFIEDHDIAEIDSMCLGIEGPHQKENAALAVAAIRTSGIVVDQAVGRTSLENARWRGRFERALNGSLIIDAAHNAHAAEALVAAWKEAFGEEKACLIFGAVEDKPYRKMLAILATIADEIIYVAVNSPRSVSPETLSEDHPDPSVTFQLCPNLSSLPNFGKKRRLIAGSLFLAGEAIALLDEMQFESSAQ